MSRAAMGKNGAVPTCQNRCHPLAPQSNAAMAEGKDPSVQWHQPATFHPRLNQPSSHAQAYQLAVRNYSVLALSQLTHGLRRLTTW